MTQPQQDSTANPSYSGIGGWLLLPAIGLVLSPIFILLFVNSRIVPFFTAAQFIGVSGELRTMLILDLVLNLAMFVYNIVIAVFFFKKRKILPKLVITLYALNLFFLLSDRFVFLTLNSEQFTLGLVRGILSSLIWIPYFLVSKRVKETFVA
jgi:hypothetical protein